MGDIGFILQNAILYTAGNEGLEKFNRAGYGTGAYNVVHTDGSLDLPRLMNMLLDTFPEEQASAIADNVLAKYVDMAADDMQAVVDNAKTYDVPGISPKKKKEEKYEDNLAKYLETEASDVRDLINEARRIRIAMGKNPPPRIAVPQKIIQSAIISPEPHLPKISIVSPLSPAGEMTEDKLESEIRRFVEGQKAHSSIDIMDFTRYLKDKGYHFQENTVLEKVYTWLEERKNRERELLLADIQGFLLHNPWPSENEVSAYIEQKKSEGIMSEGPEVKRMILVEMIRKH